MTAREQTGDSEFYCLAFADDDFTDLLRESVNVIGHAGMICGNNIFRKHGRGGNQFQPCYFC
jgi:hypothetical protein